MKSERIAKRYAKALFDFSLEKNLLENVYKDMTILKEVCANSKDFMHLLNSPVIIHSKKISVFKELFFEKLNPVSYHFLEILIKKRREMVIREISQEFVQLYKEHHKIKTVFLKTATVANEKNVLQLKEALSKNFTSSIELIQEINKSLIGGFVFKVDDLQYDASIRRNINRLKKEYNVNIYESKF